MQPGETKKHFLKLDILKQERRGGGRRVRMDASANLWTDTKEDTVSARCRRKMTRHRTQVTESFWKGKTLVYVPYSSQRSSPRTDRRVAAHFYARLFFYSLFFSRFYVNASIDREGSLRLEHHNSEIDIKRNDL